MRKKLHLKRMLATIAALLCLMPAKMLAQSQTLVLWHADGTTTEVELYTMPRIQMQADKMVITSQGVSQEFVKTDVLRFTYKGIGTGISQVNPKTAYRVDKDRVTFYGISSTDRIGVYTTGGMQIPVRLTDDGNKAILSLSSLPSGVYLVNVNGRTLKFIRP